MKSHRASAVVLSLSNRLRCTTVAAAFTLVTIGAFAQAAAPASRATELLTRDGRIAVTNAGPYVEVGTFQIQVAVKLGAPTARLADGTWLYDNFNASRATPAERWSCVSSRAASMSSASSRRRWRWR